MRGMAAVCALVLVTSNALAAMACALPRRPRARTDRGIGADQAPCPQHVADAGTGVLPDQPSGSTHCPQEDPAFRRVPGICLRPTCPRGGAGPRAACANAGHAARRRDANDSPPKPLYTRLSRLLL